MIGPIIHVVDDPRTLAADAAEAIRERAEVAIASQGMFTLALSGGSTPLALFEHWVAHPGSCPPWDRTHIFWGDEREVEESDPASNYGNARRAFIDRLSIPEANLHPIRIVGDDAEAIARRYEAELRSFFGAHSAAFPRFDVILLGLGGDGHTASLFPGSPALDDGDHLVAVSWVERLRSHRITVTLPVINNAACVMFLVDGAAKADILARVLEEPPRSHDLPAQAVRPARGELIWVVDRAAAAKLHRPPTKTAAR